MNGMHFHRAIFRTQSLVKAAKTVSLVPLIVGFLTLSVMVNAESNENNNTTTQSAKIKLSGPEKSVDGSFVVRINVDLDSAEMNGKYVQLWRSINNGDFQLVASEPNITEVAQNLNLAGSYTYQARLVSAEGRDSQSNGHIVGTSEDHSIEVNLRYPMLSTIAADF